MRLTHLKLAGFKSFVDSTTLHLHGQRVGVVGPNGCGKSNVMESIRWVLGESSAKEMRGDSMMDVIFNGSGKRKPVSRASVELVFDNSLGGAAGEWSHYAEISVKRVLERDKGSTYYINNSAVRRRDVADLFLGTGLGGRAYAIIGQNTISRIVEARPEELRVFLEEAAGVSKYKERRRETELRLRDTRENLTRVEDIRREMEKQITRLAAQAETTEHYHRLQHSLKLAQGQLWLLKKRDAASGWEKSRRLVEKLALELEAQMADLRKAESTLETLRQQHHEASAAVQTAQTRYYEINAAVSALDQQLKHTQEARERLSAQLQQIIGHRQKNTAQHALLQQELSRLQAEQQQISISETQARQAHAAVMQQQPAAEQAQIHALQAYSEAQKTLGDHEQRLRLEAAHIEHLAHRLADLTQRLQQLSAEDAALHFPGEDEIAAMQISLDDVQRRLHQSEQAMQQQETQERQLQEQIRLLRERRSQQERELARLEADIASISKLQQSVGGNGNEQAATLASWLKNAGIADCPRLWQQLSVKSGWETALESALGLRLNALVCAGELPFSHLADSRPPAAVVIAQPATGAPQTLVGGRFPPLLSAIEHTAADIRNLLHEWLTGVYMLEDGVDAEQARLELEAGAMLISQQGDVYTRHSVTIYTPQSALHGVLERQRELAQLEQQLSPTRQVLESHVTALHKAESALQETGRAQQQLQHDVKTGMQSRHGLQLEIQQLQQKRQHALARQHSIRSEQLSLQNSLNALETERRSKARTLQQAHDLLPELKKQLNDTLTHKNNAEQLFAQLRDELQQKERLIQEISFNKKIIVNKINEINNRVDFLLDENKSLQLRQQESEDQLAAAKMETLRANLQAALTAKQQHETLLAAAREHMAGVEQALQTQQRDRMQTEQLLHPQRDRLEQARLQEQQARLLFEQCESAVTASGLDEAILAEGLNAATRAGELERRNADLLAAIEALGPVNLAAIQELASERERKAYLDSQSADLEQAIATLEDAIRRIDRETRSRLQHTFDEANRNFGELFGTLFGGGHARLELLGEEILDTGMQVFAQPPGKKNSTIHLLSGGEKALTALALVFALFRLNPAPFCLMDEVDAPLDDSNTERFCNMVKKMSERTQFLFVSHNKITMEMAQQLIGVTMQESGVSRIVEVDIEAALQMHQEVLI